MFNNLPFYLLLYDYTSPNNIILYIFFINGTHKSQLLHSNSNLNLNSEQKLNESSNRWLDWMFFFFKIYIKKVMFVQCKLIPVKLITYNNFIININNKLTVKIIEIDYLPS